MVRYAILIFEWKPLSQQFMITLLLFRFFRLAPELAYSSMEGGSSSGKRFWRHHLTAAPSIFSNLTNWSQLKHQTSRKLRSRNTCISIMCNPQGKGNTHHVTAQQDTLETWGRNNSQPIHRRRPKNGKFQTKLWQASHDKTRSAKTGCKPNCEIVLHAGMR